MAEISMMCRLICYVFLDDASKEEEADTPEVALERVSIYATPDPTFYSLPMHALHVPGRISMDQKAPGLEIIRYIIRLGQL